MSGEQKVPTDDDSDDSNYSTLSKTSTTSSFKRKKQIQDWITMSKLEINKQLIIQRQQRPVQKIDLNKLPDYMTYRRKKLEEKKNMKVNYTLDITSALPRPNYAKTKSKIVDMVVPDDIEKSL